LNYSGIFIATGTGGDGVFRIELLPRPIHGYRLERLIKNREIIMMKKTTTNKTIALVLLGLFPMIALAKQPKEVIIVNQIEAPIEVSVDGGFVETTPVPVVAAAIQPVSLKLTIYDFSQLYQVQRDAVLKFVNISFTSAQAYVSNGLIKCEAYVELTLVDKDDPIRLAQINFQGYIPFQKDDEELSSREERSVTFHSGEQFLTGDILVPAGSTLAIGGWGTGGVGNGTCEAEASTMLFEL
jgi:hypothetical protein